MAKLLELGADPNLRTAAGSTAMHLAAAYGHYTVVRAPPSLARTQRLGDGGAMGSDDP